MNLTQKQINDINTLRSEWLDLRKQIENLEKFPSIQNESRRQIKKHKDELYNRMDSIADKIRVIIFEDIYE